MHTDAYGCVVANRFGNLLDDDADPFDIMSEVDVAKEKKKKKKRQEKEGDEMNGKQKKTGQKESQKDRRLPLASDPVKDPVPPAKQQQQQQSRPAPMTESRNVREKAPRGTKRVAFGERGTNQEEYPQKFSISKGISPEEKRGRGPLNWDSVKEAARPSYTAESDVTGRGGIGGRRGRGGFTRTPDNFTPREKREGISPEEKRGRGPLNWDSVKKAASELLEVTSVDPVKPKESQMPVEEENRDRPVEEDGEMVVQVAMEMTLDEWKALQEMSRPKAEFNIRKAENKIPSKAKVIHESKYLEKFKGTIEDMEDDGNFLRKSVNDITSRLEINFGSLGRPSRGGRGRGARGAPTSRPETAKPILERENDLAPNPDDPDDFPALSARS